VHRIRNCCIAPIRALSCREVILSQEIPTMPDTESAIRERAYAIWEESGRPLGLDKEHWYRAAREVALTVPAPGAVTRLRQAARTAAKKNARPSRA
jgi:hypothetical protein